MTAPHPTEQPARARSRLLPWVAVAFVLAVLVTTFVACAQMILGPSASAFVGTWRGGDIIVELNEDHSFVSHGVSFGTVVDGAQSRYAPAIAVSGNWRLDQSGASGGGGRGIVLESPHLRASLNVEPTDRGWGLRLVRSWREPPVDLVRR